MLVFDWVFRVSPRVRINPSIIRGQSKHCDKLCLCFRHKNSAESSVLLSSSPMKGPIVQSTQDANIHQNMLLFNKRQNSPLLSDPIITRSNHDRVNSHNSMDSPISINYADEVSNNRRGTINTLQNTDCNTSLSMGKYEVGSGPLICRISSEQSSFSCQKHDASSMKQTLNDGS